MSKIIRIYLPAIAMAFMIIVLYVSCISLAGGDLLGGFASFSLELFCYLVVSVIVDALVGKINFNSYIAHFTCETAALYPITGTFAYYGHWFEWNGIHIMLYTILYIIIMVAIHVYFYYLEKKEASQINDYLNLKKEDEKHGRSGEI